MNAFSRMRPQVSKSRSLLSTSVISDRDFRKAFPQLSGSRRDEYQGRFAQSMAVIKRLYDISMSSFGPVAPSSLSLTSDLVRLMARQGEFTKATTILESHISACSIDQEGKYFEARYLQSLSSCRLQSGQLTEAQNIAERSLSIVKSGVVKEATNAMLFRSSSLVGLSALQRCDLANALVAFKNADAAAKSATEDCDGGDNNSYKHNAYTYIDQYVAMNNLAVVEKLSHTPSLPPPHPPLPGNGSTSPQNSMSLPLSSPLQRWQIDFSRSFIYPGAASSDGNNGDIQSTSEMAEEDFSTRDSNFYRALHSSTAKREMAEDVDVTIKAEHVKVRASLIASAAEEVLGRIGSGDGAKGDAELASKLLADALSTIDSFLLHMQSRINTTSTTSAVDDIDFKEFLDPELGRILGLVALTQMHAGKAVMAEGLLRNALQKLSGPYGQHDRRSQYEKALILGRYGQLLSKWDKRERESQELIEQAQTQLHHLYGAVAMHASVADASVQHTAGARESVAVSSSLPLLWLPSHMLLYPSI